MSKPQALNILVDNIYENSSSLLAPLISWQYYDVNNDEQESFHLKIGTAPQRNDILDTGVVTSSSHEYYLPSYGYEALLKNGLKYLLNE